MERGERVAGSGFLPTYWVLKKGKEVKKKKTGEDKSAWLPLANLNVINRDVGNAVFFYRG